MSRNVFRVLRIGAVLYGGILRSGAVHDLERRVELRREVEALQVCSGIVAGLYNAERSGFELHQYAEDAPAELASRAVSIWSRRRRQHALSRQFVEKFTPDWDWLAD